MLELSLKGCSPELCLPEDAVGLSLECFPEFLARIMSPEFVLGCLIEDVVGWWEWVTGYWQHQLKTNAPDTVDHPEQTNAPDTVDHPVGRCTEWTPEGACQCTADARLWTNNGLPQFHHRPSILFTSKDEDQQRPNGRSCS
ncbi:hypothetical protein DM860_013062 [Cuscuta australis]|uniref:Uncharacterized protein n=1 Tax=Cuscuta australis TaxID=267555 RepID=A0A328D6C3_9ASTE|nr:hypothetical protein DM860_013062 [Cuscuta australis]